MCKSILCLRVLNAVCKHAELRGLVVQQGGSKALIPLALDGTDKGTRCAASALARIGITQDPAIAFPGQRACDVVRPISLLLDSECEGLENFKSLMALGILVATFLSSYILDRIFNLTSFLFIGIIILKRKLM